MGDIRTELSRPGERGRETCGRAFSHGLDPQAGGKSGRSAAAGRESDAREAPMTPDPSL
jgi:hypothetical protein